MAETMEGGGHSKQRRENFAKTAQSKFFFQSSTFYFVCTTNKYALSLMLYVLQYVVTLMFYVMQHVVTLMFYVLQTNIVPSGPQKVSQVLGQGSEPKKSW